MHRIASADFKNNRSSGRSAARARVVYDQSADGGHGHDETGDSADAEEPAAAEAEVGGSEKDKNKEIEAQERQEGQKADESEEADEVVSSSSLCNGIGAACFMPLKFEEFHTLQRHGRHDQFFFLHIRHGRRSASHDVWKISGIALRSCLA